MKIGSKQKKTKRRVPMLHALRPTISEWDPMKLKTFCTAKDSITQMKRQSIEEEKSLPAIHLTES